MRTQNDEIHRARHALMVQWQKEHFPWIITVREACELWKFGPDSESWALREFVVLSQMGLAIRENGKTYALDVDHGETVESITERRLK